jgi:hypothetical protein
MGTGNMGTDGTFTLFLLPRNRGQSRLSPCLGSEGEIKILWMK